jgi:hypothetical protein
VDVGGIIALVTGILGVCGLVFTALRFNRDDTTAAVATQSSVLHDMAALNDELRKTTTELRTERDELRGQVRALGVEVERLRHDRRHQLPPGGER